eukprot:scaffold13966_cov110-Skeletonema_dohrnii-CCMP3373.AAC.8
MTTASTSALVLIGWDDIKGRPIYSKKQPDSSSSVPAKKKKAPIKKGIIVTAERKKAKTKSHRGNHNKNGKERRNIPTVQVAVGSLMTGTANDDTVELSFDKQSNQQQPSFRAVSKPARKVSFSPTSKSYDNDTAKRRDSTNSSKPIIVPNTKSWDKKRRGYGSKKFSHGSGYISPVFVLESAGGNHVGWSGTSTSVGNDQDDKHSDATDQLDMQHENEGDEVLSVVNDDLSSTLERIDGVDVSFSPTSAADAGDSQSVGHDSINSSLDNHSGSEQKGSSGSFNYGELDNHDDYVHPLSINQPTESIIPEMIHVETDVTVTNDDDDDLTVKAEEPCVPLSTNSASHHTPSTKMAEETSYRLHSGGTNDFIDYDIPLDEPNALDNLIQKGGGKKRSYGCSEKPVWVTNRQAKASTAATSGNVVGWDEVKCRPIYAKPKKKVDENELDESIDDVCGDISGDNANDANIKSHKRRSYSSCFRKTSLTKAIEQMSVLTSPKEADDHSDIESSQEQDNCSSRDDVNLDSENDEEEDGTRTRSNVDFDFEMDEEVSNDENARHIQPTESSSLEAARAFFRYLDSNHRLVVDQTDASPRVSSEVIRTTRQIVHSDQLRTEYSEYCDMLAQTGVAPITISEFANNWNRYFVGKGIRDGLFDED